MNDTTRKRLAAVILTFSLLGGTLMAAMTTSFESAWTGGNSQPPSGLFHVDGERTVAGSNETHTGQLTSRPR